MARRLIVYAIWAIHKRVTSMMSAGAFGGSNLDSKLKALNCETPNGRWVNASPEVLACAME